MVNRKLKMSIAKEEEEGLLLKKDEDKDEGGQQYQSQFHLLQLNDDCLLLLFTQMTVLQAFELGFTCRRLYGLYRDSLAKRRSLLIHNYGIFVDNEHLLLFDQSPAEAADSLPHPIPKVDHLNFPKYKPSVICHLLTCMPGLVSLEIRNVEANEFCQMVATLNRTQAKLQSLKLDVIDFSRGEQMEPLQLELPSLKHLSLWADENSSEFLLCNPIFLTVMPQLTSFQIYIINFIEKSWYLSTILPFIGKHVYSNAQLVAAARSGSANLNVSLKIRSLFFWCKNDNDPTGEKAACLELITSLEALWFEDPMTESFTRRLSLMRNLKRLIIIPCTRIQSAPEDSYSTLAPPLPYQRLFNALVNTPLLEVLKLDFCGDTFPGHFNKADFPVLPTVRSFSLLYRTPAKYYNPLRVFQLEHIFPGLTELNLTYVQKECSVCDRFKIGLMPLKHNFPGLKELAGM
ncbi:hypothetical protein TYRP_005086 [Tyrophagus putrescentiae]|nr:hypothetical protein TYRP_005086 [Tyrophagus putrescentiae]